MIKCEHCNGTGHSDEDCDFCKGFGSFYELGSREAQDCDCFDGKAVCQNCDGEGELQDDSALCKLCFRPTTGSVGAAGIRWSFLCQECKDKEDAAARAQIKSMKFVLDRVLAPLEGRVS